MGWDSQDEIVPYGDYGSRVYYREDTEASEDENETKIEKTPKLV
jgi:hypothetical protein